MATYYLVALLATLYPIVIGLTAFEFFKKRAAWQKIDGWFRQTLNSLLDASLLFSISMLLAAIYRFASALQNPNGDDNTFFYSLLNAATTALFLVFPPLILQLTAHDLRRKGVRILLWLLVVALVTTLTTLYYIWRGPARLGEYYSQYPHLGKTLFLEKCDQANLRVDVILDRSIITAQVILVLNLPCWIYYVFAHISKHSLFATRWIRVPGTLQSSGSHPIWRRLARYRSHFQVSNVVLCCATMWLLLGTFTAMAIRVANEEGEWGKDRRWSIGQVLAMATFAPLIIDMAAMAICTYLCSLAFFPALPMLAIHNLSLSTCF